MLFRRVISGNAPDICRRENHLVALWALNSTGRKIPRGTTSTSAPSNQTFYTYIWPILAEGAVFSDGRYLEGPPDLYILAHASVGGFCLQVFGNCLVLRPP